MRSSHEPLLKETGHIRIARSFVSYGKSERDENIEAINNERQPQLSSEHLRFINASLRP